VARMVRREVLAEGDSGVPSDKTVYANLLWKCELCSAPCESLRSSGVSIACGFSHRWRSPDQPKLRSSDAMRLKPRYDLNEPNSTVHSMSQIVVSWFARGYVAPPELRFSCDCRPRAEARGYHDAAAPQL